MIDAATIAYRACQDWHASQRQDELAAAIAVVAAAAPKVIVEIGCDAGGTLYAWRQICDDVYGITLPDNSPPTGGQGYQLVTHGAEVLRGDSHDASALNWLMGVLDGRPVDVLVIDGDHSYAGARADWDTYTPLVADGGLVLLHDVLNVWDRRVDLARLWEEVGGSEVIASRARRPVGWGVFHMRKD